MFNVTYLDDFNQKHIFIAESFKIVKFLMDRFYNVEYEPMVDMA